MERATPTKRKAMESYMRLEVSTPLEQKPLACFDNCLVEAHKPCEEADLKQTIPKKMAERRQLRSDNVKNSDCCAKLQWLLQPRVRLQRLKLQKQQTLSLVQEDAPQYSRNHKLDVAVRLRVLREVNPTRRTTRSSARQNVSTNSELGRKQSTEASDSKNIIKHFTRGSMFQKVPVVRLNRMNMLKITAQHNTQAPVCKSSEQISPISFKSSTYMLRDRKPLLDSTTLNSFSLNPTVNIKRVKITEANLGANKLKSTHSPTDSITEQSLWNCDEKENTFKEVVAGFGRNNSLALIFGHKPMQFRYFNSINDLRNFLNYLQANELV